MMQDVTHPAPAKAAGEGLERAGTEAVKTVSEWSGKATFYAVEYGPKVLGVLVVLFAAWVIAGWVRRLILAGLARTKFDLTLAKFFANMARWTILVMGVLACLETFGIRSTSVAAVVGAVGLAIALGFQGTLGNLAAGVLLLIFRPFKIGDAVIVAGQTGVVDGIDLFTTNLDTADYRRIIIPNGAIFNAIIENTSHHPRRSVTVNVPVSGAADLEQTRATLAAAVERVAASTPGVLRDPAPAVVLADLLPTVTWSVTVWSQTAHFPGLRPTLLRELKLAVEGAGLAPPPPTMNVHVQSMPKA